MESISDTKIIIQMLTALTKDVKELKVKVDALSTANKPI